jgi:hypothetical protein
MEQGIDYAANVRQYTSTVDFAAVNGIVKYLGIALRNQDSAIVAGSDPTELTRLREAFMKRRLRISAPDAELDAAVQDVMAQMAADRRKSRVTVCYLLAEKFGKLPLFV